MLTMQNTKFKLFIFCEKSRSFIFFDYEAKIAVTLVMTSSKILKWSYRAENCNVIKIRFIHQSEVK